MSLENSVGETTREDEEPYGDETLHCDFCTEIEWAGDLDMSDWNGETGNHLSCEGGNHEGDPTRNGTFA